MTTLRTIFLSLGLALLVLLPAAPAAAQWAAEPGATVRDAFGPGSGYKANQCRGACGGGCPKSCTRSVVYECLGPEQLRRVVSFDCGTHEGCRVHDNCLDACVQDSEGSDSTECQTQCDGSIMQSYGASAVSWLTGRGPYDGRILFEYTRDAPDGLAAAFRCPEGTDRQCSGESGCASADGELIEPLFDSYPAGPAGAMQVSSFRSGLVCDEQVCTYAVDIPVTGKDSCPGGRCTRFGMEFDYRNADPTAPLECKTSTRGGDDDFVGDLLKLGADAMTSRSGTAAEESKPGAEQNGMAALAGIFGKVLASADSPEDVDISITPLDEQGNPIESQRVGSAPNEGPPPIPRSIDLPASNGHLFVPMYQISEGMKPGMVKERRVLCTHKGAPVLETTFRLQAG